MENNKNNRVELEVEGKTVEDAVKKATEILKVSKDQLKIKIVSKNKKAFLVWLALNLLK
ncbi:MAG TPA: Jag N-terminal domain-containing protein [Candidatus Omnitrophota bacterium]|nr:Jag N-terminal domain-containing protein [Candidatus Omnitrophota bacterium]